MRDTADLFLESDCAMMYANAWAIILDNNTFDLLLVAKVNIAPDPDSDERERSDGGSCNAHIPLCNTKSSGNCVSSWGARLVLECVEVV